MSKTTIMCRCLKNALGRCLLAGTVCVLATGAFGQVDQCIPGKISSQECWVGLQVSGGSVTVSPPDVALYSDTKISWKRTDTADPSITADFAVDFDSSDCTPFRGISHFDQSSTAAAIADELPASHFKRCKYKVTIGNLTADRQVIVIGGPKHHDTSWSRRHLGQSEERGVGK